jgi:hypothetical protein
LSVLSEKVGGSIDSYVAPNDGENNEYLDDGDDAGDY